jgi:hypothetical protein
MSESIRHALAHAVEDEAPREQRARAAAEIIRNARAYRWVGIYDVGDEEIVLIGGTGTPSVERERFPIDERVHGEVLRTRRTMIGKEDAISPVLGAESAIVIGTLDAEVWPTGSLDVDDFDFLEDCAAILRPLYD